MPAGILLEIRQHFVKLGNLNRTRAAALEMRVVDDHAAAGELQLRHQRNAAAEPPLHERQRGRKPGVRLPETGLSLKVNDSRLEDGQASESGLSDKRLAAAFLAQFLKFGGVGDQMALQFSG